MFRLIALRLHIWENLDMLFDAADELDDGTFFSDDSSDAFRESIAARHPKSEVYDEG